MNFQALLIVLISIFIALQLALEVGTFFGYSALWTAQSLPPGGRLVCVEASLQNAEVARQVLKLAKVRACCSRSSLPLLCCPGLPWRVMKLRLRRCYLAHFCVLSSCAPVESVLAHLCCSQVDDRVEIVVGLGATVIPTLPKFLGASGRADSADFVFLDHCKECYLKDLNALETLGLIRQARTDCMMH